jgi:alpha-beta hydrolase superfamily lysophospholipase
MYTEFTYSSSDGLKIYAYKWDTPNPKGVLHIVHGSIEHAMRYERFAEFVLQHGFAVYATDYRGHGKTADEAGQFCLFSKEKGGWDRVIEDLDQFNKIIRKENPGAKVFMFGHSMGSFLVRDYIASRSEQVNGAIIAGTGRLQKSMILLGLWLARILSVVKGRESLSPFLHNLIYGSLNQTIENPETDFDFLSRDKAEVQKYMNDPWSGNPITIEYAYELFNAGLRILDPETISKTPSDFSFLFIAGSEDPLGGENAEYVQEVVQAYRDGGFRDLDVKIYAGARHELLNEINREEVMQDIVTWMTAKL